MKKALVISSIVTLAAASLDAQPVRMRMSTGELMSVGAGRHVVLQAKEAGVVVEGVVGDAPDTVDIRVGDRIVRFQRDTVADLATLMRAYRGAATGSSVTVVVQRGASQHVVRFTKPADDAGRTMAVSGASGGAGAWTASDGASASMEILGAELRENDQGLPAVTNRKSHPLGATLALRVGDVLLELNGHPLHALRSVELWYDRVAPGGTVQLKVLRGNETVVVTFTKPA